MREETVPAGVGVNGNGNGGPVTWSSRTVPPGKIILCTEMVWWTSDEVRAEFPKHDRKDVAAAAAAADDSDKKPALTAKAAVVGGMMLKMPDGYVSEGEVERVASICGRSITPAERAAEEERARRMMMEVDGLKRQVQNLRAGLATNI